MLVQARTTPPCLIHRTLGIFLASIISFSAQAAFAGAWLQEPGHGIAIAQLAASESDQISDINGRRTDQEPYKQIVQSLYGEWGLNEQFTLGASANTVYSNQFIPSVGADGSALALTDPSLFARYGILREGPQRLSMQMTVQLPRHSWSEDGLTLGNPNSEYELALQYGRSLSVPLPALGTFPAFVDAHLGYRFRAAQPGDQIRSMLTAGITPVENWQFMLQAFGTFRTDRSSNNNGGTSFTQSNADDYDQLRLQASLVWDLPQNWSLQAGYFEDVYGRNFGLARGGLVGVWRKF